MPDLPAKNPTNRDTNEKIKSLGEIQKSLKGLDDYICNQRDELDQVAKTLSTLKSEKNQTEEILKLSAPQVLAIQESLGRQKARDKWMDGGIGVLIGLISSSLFHIALRWWNRKKEPHLPSST
jgi:hypothetical protein